MIIGGFKTKLVRTCYQVFQQLDNDHFGVNLLPIGWVSAVLLLFWSMSMSPRLRKAARIVLM